MKISSYDKPQSEVLRLLPSIDTLLRSETSLKLFGEVGAKHLAGLARFITDSMRQDIQAKISGKSIEEENYSRESLLAEAERRLEAAWRAEKSTGLRRVINATGVIIHTNLGRAPLSENAKKAIIEQAAGYCTLEFNVETGKRGKRGARAEHVLAELTGAEAALIVNNCAAAAVLVLTALANGGEAIISRGEMVEIGGDFRIPDVMKQSGAGLIEVGTTNRTSVGDYEKALSENTRLILKVHPSNYRIIGFTSSPTIGALAELAHRNDVLLYEDAGSGALLDLAEYGLTDEPLINRSITSGADVVTFSGDKLLGGTQAGLIVGRGEVIERIRKHPLYRALRVSKLIYAALEATFDAFRKGSVTDEIPVLKMIAASSAALKRRTHSFVDRLEDRLGENSNWSFQLIDGKSVIGGGSAPTVQPKTTLLGILPKNISVDKLEEKLRHADPCVVTRVFENRVVIDLRTVLEHEEAELLDILADLGVAEA